MKVFIKSSTNSVNIPARLDTINAETDEELETIQDKISDAKDDFDYILSGIEQLDTVQANDMLNELHEALQEFITNIANQLV